MNCSACGTAITPIAGPYGACRCQDRLHLAIGIDRFQSRAVEADLRNLIVVLAAKAQLADAFAAQVGSMSGGGIDPAMYGATTFGGGR